MPVHFLRPCLVWSGASIIRAIHHIGFQIACSALVSTLLASMFFQEARGAVPQSLPGDTSVRSEGNGPTPDKGSALSAISGSPWPGVIDHLLQNPLETENGQDRRFGIHINYPSFGHRNVDADIRAWVETIAATFQTHLDTEALATAREPEAIDETIERFLQDDDLLSDQSAASAADNGSFELWGSYSVSRPSDAAVSITYELWNYANGGAGNLDIITLNYNMLNGQRLNFVDIFEKPELALQLMSNWSRNRLAGPLGGASRNSMLNSGTEPLLDNFSSITLTPEGLRINFQPWQVAPWAAGIQKVDMPLEELLEAAPLLALWGKSEIRPENGARNL